MIEKLKRSIGLNYRGILLMFLSALCTASGQLFWKLATLNTMNRFFLVIGFGMYFFGALLMITAFKFGSFSVLHPLMCLSYIFAVIFSKLFLNEAMNFFKILGVLSIMIGVVLISGGDSD